MEQLIIASSKTLAPTRERMPFSHASILEGFVAPVIKGAETAPPKVIQNPKMKKLHQVFQGYMDTHKYWHRGHLADDAIRLIGRSTYSSQEIEQFSWELIAHQDHPDFKIAGIFLSVLMNDSPDRHFVVHTAHLAIPINGLGYLNSKEIVVEGDVGDETGAEMNHGQLTVQGNANDRTGYRLEGGEILIKGHAGAFTGESMKSGLLVVEGNATNGTGQYMQGGRLIIHGNVTHLCGYEMYSGKLEVRGNASSQVGQQANGGLISVYGNAGYMTAAYLKGGTVVVKGDVGPKTCEGMKSGTLQVEGRLESLYSWHFDGGDVFQRERQIVQEGRQIAQLEN